MKRYGFIYESIYSMENLYMAHAKARKDKAHYKAVQKVDENPEKYLRQIQKMLKKKTYHIGEKDYTTKTITDKGKERELWKLPYFPHRIIQWAIMLQIQKYFDETFCHHTCASLPKRGIRQAWHLMTKYLKDVEGTQYCLKIDVKKFYPNIDHEVLKKTLRKKFKDPDLLWLLDKIIDSYPGKKGVPIGSYLSQYLANFYLTYFDHWLKEDMKQKYVVRYMDDVVILAQDKATLHNLRRAIDLYMMELNLLIKDNWQVFPVDKRGVDFVGYRFFHKFILLRKKTCKTMKRKLTRMKTGIMNFNQWSSANSYKGWLKWCDSWRLEQKYLNPIKPKLISYYKKRLLGETKKETRYIKKLYSKQGRQH